MGRTPQNAKRKCDQVVKIAGSRVDQEYREIVRLVEYL